jgi:DNA-binding LytR/AlgR family response regulator
VKGANGSIDLIEMDRIFYLEAQGDDALVRTKRKKPYHSVQRLAELAKKLPAPVFVRCHRQYIVNLNRVRALTPAQLQRLRPSARPSRESPHSHRPQTAENDLQGTRSVEVRNATVMNICIILITENP